MSANTLVATLLAMSGQRNIITVPRAFVRFTGTLESAMMLNQLLYWKPRAHGEAIYKTDRDWADELCLTRYAVRKARECLAAMGFLTFSTHHVSGAPAVHYTIDFDVLVERWTSWLQEQEVKCENELYDPPSKVRKRTLPYESSSKTNRVKFENEQTMNHRVPTENLVGVGVGGRTLAFLIDQGVNAAEEFAELPYEPMCADYDARRADGQTNGSIVRAWRHNPPTTEYHYERSRSVPHERAPAQRAPAERPTVPQHLKRVSSASWKKSDSGD